DQCGNAIGFCRNEKSVNKTQRSFGKNEGGYQYCLVDVGGNNMSMAGFMWRLPDNVILPPGDSRDYTSFFRNIFNFKFHLVTNSYGIGHFKALQLEFTPQPTVVPVCLRV